MALDPGNDTITDLKIYNRMESITLQIIFEIGRCLAYALIHQSFKTIHISEQLTTIINFMHLKCYDRPLLHVTENTQAKIRTNSMV